MARSGRPILRFAVGTTLLAPLGVAVGCGDRPPPIVNTPAPELPPGEPADGPVNEPVINTPAPEPPSVEPDEPEKPLETVNTPPGEAERKPHVNTRPDPKPTLETVNTPPDEAERKPHVNTRPEPKKPEPKPRPPIVNTAKPE